MFQQYDLEARKIILKHGSLIKELHEINRQILIKIAANYTRKDIKEIFERQGINFNIHEFLPSRKPLISLNRQAVEKVIKNPGKVCFTGGVGCGIFAEQIRAFK